MNKGSKLKSAILYANSIYDGALMNKQLDSVRNDFRMLSNAFKDGIEDFKYLNSPLWSFSTKENIIETLAKKLNLCETTKNTLKVLAQNRKLNDLPIILEQFNNVYNEKQNIAEVEVQTVEKLTESQDSLLHQKLQALFNKKIIVNYQINPHIIGGLVIQCGTTQIDSSVKYKLDCLEQLMKGTK